MEGQPITRRDVLRNGVQFAEKAVVVAITSKLALPHTKAEAQELPSKIEDRWNSEETQSAIADIFEYRKKLGLFDGYPPELADGLYRQEEGWGRDPEPFSNELPVAIQSYGMRVEEVSKILFGKNADRLIVGAVQDPVAPYLLGYDDHGTVSIAVNIDEQYPHAGKDVIFDDVAFHEEGGHGTDSLSKTYLYPWPTFLHALHGKWRMFSQAFEDGGILTIEGFGPTTNLRTDIGEYIARNFRADTLKEQFKNEESIRIVVSILEQTANSQKKSLTNIAFNKNVCTIIGRNVLEQIRTGKLDLGEEFQTKYEDFLTGALVEGYAEMVRSILKKPGNTEIEGGYEEVLSAIQEQPIDINVIREALKEPREEVKKRIAFEKMLKEHDVSLATPEELERKAREEEEQKHQEQLFQNFMKYGSIPYGRNERSVIKDTLQEYAKTCAKVAIVYPFFTNTEKSHLVPLQDFDPELDIWDIKKIEYAIEQSFIRSSLTQYEKGGDIDIDIESIKNRTKTLQNFMQARQFDPYDSARHHRTE